MHPAGDTLCAHSADGCAPVKGCLRPILMAVAPKSGSKTPRVCIHSSFHVMGERVTRLTDGNAGFATQGEGVWAPPNCAGKRAVPSRPHCGDHEAPGGDAAARAGDPAQLRRRWQQATAATRERGRLHDGAIALDQLPLADYVGGASPRESMQRSITLLRPTHAAMTGQWVCTFSTWYGRLSAGQVLTHHASQKCMRQWLYIMHPPFAGPPTMIMLCGRKGPGSCATNMHDGHYALRTQTNSILGSLMSPRLSAITLIRPSAITPT